MSKWLDEPLPVAPGGSNGTAAGVEEFCAVFPATDMALGVVRGYVRAVAGSGGRRGDLELIASELASCAVRLASASGRVFTVTAQRRPGWLRVEVGTCGSGWWQAGDLGGDGADALAYGCGLALLAGLADRFGHLGTAGGAAVLWAEARLDGDDEPQQQESRSPGCLPADRSGDMSRPR
jgi:hypothetical protein